MQAWGRVQSNEKRNRRSVRKGRSVQTNNELRGKMERAHGTGSSQLVHSKAANQTIISGRIRDRDLCPARTTRTFQQQRAIERERDHPIWRRVKRLFSEEENRQMTVWSEPSKTPSTGKRKLPPDRHLGEKEGLPGTLSR